MANELFGNGGLTQIETKHKQFTTLIKPKQPFFVTSTSQYFKYPIMNYGISHFYCFKTDPSVQTQAIAIPDGCIDILFCCNEKNPQALICGSVLKPKAIHSLSATVASHYFGVRFLPGYNPVLGSNITMSDLIGNEIPFNDLIDDKKMFDAITSSNDFLQQSKIFMESYLKIYQRTDFTVRDNALIEYIMSGILHGYGNIKIEEIVEKTGYTLRYADKVFKNEVGLTPKTFSKIMRFQHLIGRLNTMDGLNLAQLSSDMGYFDQSHMVKDFRQYADTTPNTYIHTLQKVHYNKRLIILK